MKKKQDDFKKGMIAGARPFEEKFENLSRETHQIGKDINDKMDVLSEGMDILADGLSDMEKRELYHLNTPYDLKEDLDDDEKEIVSALLLSLSKYTENNEYQKRFIRSVNSYIGINTPQTGFDIACIENIENIKSQKIIMQTMMEYLYLSTEDFSFLEEKEELFEHFSVNKKGIQEIKLYIEKIHAATGKEGIAEKYGFVPKEEIQIQEDEKREYEFPCYDGSDISEACADAINVHPYVVLKDYLVAIDYKQLYRVHKKTGEKKEINVDITLERGINKECICGYDKYLYFVHSSGFYMMDVETDTDLKKVKDLDIVFEEEASDVHKETDTGPKKVKDTTIAAAEKVSDVHKIKGDVQKINYNIKRVQCNEKGLIYSFSITYEEVRSAKETARHLDGGNSFHYVNLESMEEQKINIACINTNFILGYNTIFFISDQDCNGLADGALYEYNIETREQKKITVLDFDEVWFSSFLSRYDDNAFFGACIQKTYQYDKYIISLKNTRCKNEVYYYCLDMENAHLDLIKVRNLCENEILCATAYNYIYCFSTSSSIERYNILTSEKEEIIHTDSIVDYIREGILRRKKPYIAVWELNIVGNWLYYSSGTYSEDCYKVCIKEKNLKGKFKKEK